MKVTGYTLREAIKQHELRRDTAARQFDGSLFRFPGETKSGPANVMTAFLRAEGAIAKLQVAQMRYNLAVMVVANGETMTLGQAVKYVGGEARAEKMWRSATGSKKDPYSRREERSRDTNTVVAEETISVSQAVEFAAVAAKAAGALRAAIATGNAQEKEIDLDPALLE